MTQTPVPTTPDDILMALDCLLDRERAAVLAGALDALAPLIDQKSALIDALTALDTADDPTGPGMDSLRAKARRNQDLIESAMEGIRSVAQRLATLRRLRVAMDTYDSTGQRRPILTAGRGKIEKRA